MAKALTKEDYEAQGAKAFHARSTLTERFGVSKATTWQQRAFLSGWQKAHDCPSINEPPTQMKKLKKDTKLGVVPIRPSLKLFGFERITDLPRPVVRHLDDLSYRYQFAIKERVASRYRASASRVASRWALRLHDKTL